MVLVEVTGKFYAESGDGPRDLAILLGEDGSVSYDAASRIAVFHLERTLEDETAAATERVLADCKTALAGAGVGSADADLFELSTAAEELLAIGGNLHKRGPLIEAKARERRDEMLRT